MNKIITLANVGYKIDDKNFIKNLNLDFYNGENVLITGKDYVISNLMIDLITGYVKPQIGNVNTQPFDQKRYFIGYNNFEAVLKHGAQVQDIINTLITSQRHLVNDNDEVNELIGLFALDKLFTKSTNELTADQLFLLNLLMLLIVKPRIVILKQLPLIGSINFRLSTLKYIYNYTKKYDISLILTTDNQMITDNLIDRRLIIENGKVISDVSISVIANYATNNIDNKTKEFNLENVLINALNSSYPKPNSEQSTKAPTTLLKTQKIPTASVPTAKLKTQQMNMDLPTKSGNTKTVRVEFDGVDHNQASPTVQPTITDDLVNYADVIENFTTASPTEKNTTNNAQPPVQEPTSSNFTKKTTGLNATNRTTRRPTDFLISDEDIYKFNTSAIENENHPSTARVTSAKSHTTQLLTDPTLVTRKLNQITKEFELINAVDKDADPFEVPANLTQAHLLEDKLNETESIRNALESQIKAPEFSDLPIQLQSQILDNYEQANQIIDENIKHLTEQLNLDNDTVTKELVREQQNAYQPTNRLTRKTSIIDETPPTRTTTPTRKTKTVNADTANNESDLFYYDNEKPGALYDLWRKKRQTENLNNDDNFNNELPSSENSASVSPLEDQIDNYTNNLNPNDDLYNAAKNGFETHVLHQHPSSTFKPNDQFNENDDSAEEANEPSQQLLDDLTNHKINQAIPTRRFSPYAHGLEDETPVTSEPIKVIPIKRRSKLNSIEKLYQEALEDLNAVEEQKNQQEN